MLEICIHFSGQDSVVVSYLLATTVFFAGKYNQVFWSFGAKRRSASVIVRLAKGPFKCCCQRRSIWTTCAAVTLRSANRRGRGGAGGLRDRSKSLAVRPGVFAAERLRCGGRFYFF